MKYRNFFKPELALIATLLAAASCMPNPDYCHLREKHADYDAWKLDMNVVLPEHPLTLPEIIQIAMDRNLDVQLQRLEESFQYARIYAQKLRMLPDGTPNADINNRDNNPGWFSRVVNLPGGPGPIGPTATQSTSKWVRLYDLTAAWNIIDFGLSYVRTKQEKNKFFLTEQKNLRARQNLVLDIYRAYYRAIVAKQAVSQAKVLIEALTKRQETLKSQVSKQLVSEMQGLVNENRLIDLQIKLYAFENEYKSAVTEVSALMGLPPGSCLQLADLIYQDIEIDDLCICEFEKMALRYRPELMAQDMQFLIDTDEVKASIIEMFPNARFFASAWHDDDMFAFNHDWFKFGTTISWNLLQLPAKYQNKGSLEIRRRIAWETRLSMSMGVITQVHLSYINVQESKIQYGLAKELYSVKNRQLNVSRVLERSGELSTDDVLVFEVEALFARVNAIKAFANLQISLEQLSNSVGRPLLFTPGDMTAIELSLENCCYFNEIIPFDISRIRRTPATIFVEDIDLTHQTPVEEEEEELEYYDVERQVKEMKEQDKDSEQEKLERAKQVEAESRSSEGDKVLEQYKLQQEIQRSSEEMQQSLKKVPKEQPKALSEGDKVLEQYQLQQEINRSSAEKQHNLKTGKTPPEAPAKSSPNPEFTESQRNMIQKSDEANKVLDNMKQTSGSQLEKEDLTPHFDSGPKNVPSYREATPEIPPKSNPNAERTEVQIVPQTLGTAADAELLELERSYREYLEMRDKTALRPNKEGK